MNMGVRNWRTRASEYPRDSLAGSLIPGVQAQIGVESGALGERSVR